MQIQAGLFPKINLLFQLIIERLIIIFKSKNNRKQEFLFSWSLVKDFVSTNFSNLEKLFCLIIICILFFIFSFIYDFLTYGSIDKALRNQQSARAESLIKQRLLFNPEDNSLKLRLAHAYLTLGRSSEAKNIIEDVQAVNPQNPYIGKVARELAGSLRLSKREYQAIPILEKIPVNACKECLTDLLDLYTIEGRRSLMQKNIERANYFLSRALKLAEKVKESNSSMNHRKRELAKAYNLQAFQLIEAKQITEAIKILEISKDIFPIGQTYLMLGKLYLEKENPSIEDLRSSLDCLDKAYSFGLVESETEFRKALKVLKQKFKEQGLSNKEIIEETKNFQLSSVKIAEESAKEIIEENTETISEIKKKKPEKIISNTNNETQIAESKAAEIKPEIKKPEINEETDNNKLIRQKPKMYGSENQNPTPTPSQNQAQVPINPYQQNQQKNRRAEPVMEEPDEDYAPTPFLDN